MIQFAKRIQPLNKNVFADMDRAKTQARNSGKKIIDLSLGSSDLPTPEPTIKTIETALRDRTTHGYLLYNGTKEFRDSAAKWYTKRFAIPVDPETEVLQLIGSQEGTAHLPLAILNPGDYALLLDPGYPSHAGGVYLAGGQIYPMALLEKNQFLPVFSDIPNSVLSQAKMMVLSYPHNPTTAIATLSFFQEAVAFCQKHDLALVHDFPYVDMFFEEELQPPSVLQADLDKTISIEFFTMSKSYNMGGFRVGFAIGNKEIIKALRQIKAVVDFNQYLGILRGAVTALSGSQESVAETVKTFKVRRDALITALNNIGWKVPKPQATMYIWAKLPESWNQSSMEFCTQLVHETGIALSPGSGFGESGEGYVRFALVQEPEILELAATKISEFLKRHRVC